LLRLRIGVRTELQSLGLGIVPNLAFLKKKKKAAGSYEMQELQKELENERGKKTKSAAVEDEESSEDELLVKTGKSTLSYETSELPALPEKVATKRIRIYVNPGGVRNV
jgi:hypothetical protein